MQKLEMGEMQQVNGGSVSGTLVNALTSLFKFIYELGKTTGETIKDIITPETECN